MQNRSFSPEIWAKLWKGALFCNVKEFCKNPGSASHSRCGGAFPLYRNWWPWMTLNSIMAVILRYSTNSVQLA